MEVKDKIQTNARRSWKGLTGPEGEQYAKTTRLVENNLRESLRLDVVEKALKDAEKKDS
jgi:hypothetical protein